MTDDPARRRTLVLGGARSGKSAHAEHLATSAGPDVRYVATARIRPDDEDFRRRIAVHHARRPTTWTVVENTDLVEVLRTPGPTIVADDVGTWLTARIDDAGAWDLPRGTVPTADLVDAVAHYSERLLLVSPEVGLGVVPPTASGRLFRDELGDLNQRLARVCDEVLFVVAGLPMRLK